MRNSRFLPRLFALLFLFAVVSCRDNEQSQPKPNKTSRARLISNGTSIGDWEASLTWEQRNWIDQQADPDAMIYDLWNDERTLSTYLADKEFSENISIDYPLFCFQVAAISALHVASVGASAAQAWVKITYADTNSPYGNDVMVNFNTGKQVALSNTTAASYDLPDLVYYALYIAATGSFKIPGEVYVGTYNAVPLYTAPYLMYGSFTIPGTTRAKGRIYLQINYQNDQDLIRHEFGHILQGQDFGLTCYYTKVVPASLKSAATNGPNHKCFKTETDANRRSYDLLHLQYPNTIWNQGDYPFSCTSWDSSEPCP